MNEASDALNLGAWPVSARLIARWIDRRERLDALLETLPKTLTGVARARCQHLVLGVIRHFGRLDAALVRLVAHPPRFETRGALLVAGYELIEAANEPQTEGLAAKIVHHAVEQTKTLASPAEARLVNAVGRKLAVALASPPPPADAPSNVLAEYFSHPEWLIRNWHAQFGPAATRRLLEWNQRPAPVHARWRSPSEPVPDFLKPTKWPGYFEVTSGHWPEIEQLLQAGKIYLQDPATRLPVDLLDPKPGERILDLCAAPGGKSLLIADAIGTAEKTGPPGSTQLVAMDLPGARIDRLKENLSRVTSVNAALVQADLLADAGRVLREHRLPMAYDAVLLDAPCSNTGVMRHRVDVKWRLEPGDLKKHPKQQLALLHAAARLVTPNGRLVYTTCSIDTEENEYVVREFLATRFGQDFALEDTVLSMPWDTGHDGGAAFRLRRKA
jgi:16S rRNA (cytosine967-C5)-methyltransferase